MSEFVEALYSRLQAVAGVTTLVSARVYPVRLPQGVTYPAIRYTTIDTQRDSALSADMGLAWPRMQIDSYAQTYLGAKQLATAVRAALKRATWTQDGIDVRDALLEQEADDYESDVEAFRIRQDYVFVHQE